jgi:hypothetical protein
MGIEQAEQALDQDLNNASAEAAPATGQPEQSGPFNLDTAEKVSWKGKEYTPAQFEKMMMMQSDYTKSKQAIAEERKYVSNLRYDLQAVKKNPALANEFLKTYPKEFHAYLEDVMPQGWQNGAKEASNLPPEVQEKLEFFENYINEQNVSKEEANLDRISTSMMQKYPEAIEDFVLARAEAYVNQNKNITPEVWDKLYKESHDFMLKKVAEKQNKTFDTQKNANLKGRGIGPGGGTPGQAPVKRNFAQATEAAIKDLSGRR